MGPKKHGTDYGSFAYLEKDKEFKAFELAEEIDRVMPDPVILDPDEETRAESLGQENILISMHEHLGIFPSDPKDTRAYIREGRMATAFQGLALSSWDAVFDNLMDGICTIESRSGWKWTEILHDLGMRLCDLAHQDFLIPCRGVPDIARAHEQGKIAWIPTMEGAAMIENELDRIDILYGFGVRSMGITYSEANALGTGLKESNDGGLTRFGRRAVQRMNKIGMLIDCSHCGDQTTLDVIEASDQPIVLSHIGARALWDSRRMAPDEVLESCAARGGVIGIEAAPHTTLTAKHPRHCLDSVMEHFEYIKERVGIDHVSFGPDTVYGDHVGLHETYAANLSIKEVSGSQEIDRVDYVRGLENPTEGSTNILRWLVKRGYSDDKIAKVLGGNTLRVLQQVWV